mmetsp:Transcript_16853/g.46057  ORF Transcript_16853/g.46057 Transcript_16853/m.46057 type:complete len:356 (+) Transcript_16853:255-1322(+)
MRHDDHGAAAHERVERSLHELLALRVQRRRRLVEQQDPRVRHDGARDGDALLLPAAQLRAALTAQRIVLARQRVDEGVRVGHVAGLFHLGLRRALLAVPHVVRDGRREEHGLLRNEADVLPQPPHVDVGQAGAVEEHAALLRVVEAHDELDHGRLAAAAAAYERYRRARRDVEVELVEDARVLACGVGEADAAQRDLAAEGVRAAARLAVDVDGGDAVHNLHHAAHRDPPLAEGRDGGREVAQVEAGEDDGEEDHDNVAARVGGTGGGVVDVVDDQPPSEPQAQRIVEEVDAHEYAEADCVCPRLLEPSQERLAKVGSVPFLLPFLARQRGHSTYPRDRLLCNTPRSSVGRLSLL